MSEQARTVERVITPQTVLEGAGVRLRRSIATPALDYVDPFLLFDHFGSDEPADYVAGFPWHPHRGIETVTYMLAGEVDHHDSIGNAGRIGPGDVQWMTAGGGIMHEEMPRPGDDGRRMGGFQLWVNLPASLKMSHPRYQDLSTTEIPEVRRADGTVIRVVAGQVDGVRGAVTEIYAEPEYLDVSLPAGGRFAQPVSRGHAALAYAFEGEGRFGVAGDLGYRGELDGGRALPSCQQYRDGPGPPPHRNVRVRRDHRPAGGATGGAAGAARPAARTPGAGGADRVAGPRRRRCRAERQPGSSSRADRAGVAWAIGSRD